jgi:DMSO/TMAO reductase YedYZ heme-binding membrane subunit
MNQLTLRQTAVLGAALTLLAAPLWIFLSAARPLAYFGGTEFPPGQAAYLMMRPAGHIAFVLVFVQIVLGALGPRLGGWMNWPGLGGWHRVIGMVALGFVLLHPLLFAWGRTLRAGQLELLPTFFPNPGENYWELMLFVGALAMYALLFGAAAAIWGRRLAPRSWRWIHAINYLGFLLAYWHSIRIGSETRISFLPVLYSVMAVMVAVLLAMRVLRALKEKAITPESAS